jgi:hypothetical protein
VRRGARGSGRTNYDTINQEKGGQDNDTHIFVIRGKNLNVLDVECEPLNWRTSEGLNSQTKSSDVFCGSAEGESDEFCECKRDDD